jgi:hypothetical protein
MDALENYGSNTVHLGTPLRIIERLRGLQQQFEIAQITVTQ